MNQRTAAPEALTTAFLPLHKLAMGVAVGTGAALAMFLVTAIYLIRDPQPGFELGLLRQFFAGYEVTWTGAVIGAAWAWFCGFVLGWFLAFSRNFLVAVMTVVIRTRAELAQTRDFLDHI